jgi:hypothetical protein
LILDLRFLVKGLSLPLGRSFFAWPKNEPKKANPILALTGSLRFSELNEILRNSLRSNTVVFDHSFLAVLGFV